MLALYRLWWFLMLIIAEKAINKTARKLRLLNKPNIKKIFNLQLKINTYKH